MNRMIDLTSSVVASTLRSWRGSMSSKASTLLKQPIQLFDQEGHPQCRLVREAITELNLDTMIYPCPEGGTRHTERLKELAGHQIIPFLYDPNTGYKATGVNAIVSYLFDHYSKRKAPSFLLESPITVASSKLASLARFQAGTKVRASKTPNQSLTLYSFEASPFSRLVREKLSELELPYLLVNLGKQQRADIGPAVMRLTLKPYRPLPGTKRDEFFKKYGDVQVPFLIDPNNDTEMFESADIVRYLEDKYAL
ncbi:MAG: glutathione S-transferase N-terminal domain-containing protein [Pseudomonadales bacterium]|nr:glutathione S-transferase N-terminal domain-containing protein [Pseudomonadales bacterium]